MEVKNVLNILTILCMFGLQCSCTEPYNHTNSGVPVVIPVGDERYLNEGSKVIFNQDTLHTFELRLSESALDFLDDDPTAEKYVEGSLIFNGETISPVGIRYKGSIGAFVESVSGRDWTKPSGRKIATKLSMKIKINWEDKGKTFYGLKKLQFHSQNLDPTQMHERLGYWLYREMGVSAPRSVHARLIINGVYTGVYALTEQIDKQFVRSNYENTNGNLYKEVWPLKWRGGANSEHAFIAGLKTNKGKKASAHIMKSFADELIASNEEDLQGVIEKRMEIDEIIAYAVVDRMIRNDDGAFHWYCDESGCGNHNYYWYEDPISEKLYLIPWDLDNAFENIVHNVSPVTTIADDWGEISHDCHRFPYGRYGIWQKSAACDKLTGGWASYTEEYDQRKSQFINGPFSNAEVNAQLDKWAEQIREATIEASMNHRDAISPEEWDKAIKKFKIDLEYARVKK
jgi:spore coat protein CotH